MKTTRNELKLRADKCPIKRFKAFIGKANTQATLCADTGIEIIGWSGFDASDLNAKSHRVELARFIAAADPETILALLAELEAKDKRIAVLEAIRADSSQVFKEIGNELGCNPDNESIMMAIDELKKDNTSLRDQRAGLVQAASELGAKLATPVRLPDVLFIKVSGSAVPVMHAGRVKERVRAAGFTVEGDE